MTLRDGDWKGEPCVIVGGGPSAEAIVPGLSRFPGRIVAVSRAGLDMRKHTPLWLRVSAWVGIDWTFWASDEVASGTAWECAPRVWIDDGGNNLTADRYDVRIPGRGDLWQQVTAQTLNGPLSEGVNRAGHSGYAAIHLAYLLGADPIYLVGFDCSPGTWTTGPGIAPNQNTFNAWMASTLRLAALIAERGRRVRWVDSGAAAPEEELYGA